ncbi:hypothetical protein L3Q82_024331 [Scortum barcoo]|uniref:Uncharacterized protein n=1 Tax=Scortum barcoo TaxID=214431 RepID=A0ACB8WWX6_9TELE|nr:hypothetical protein L3Q82_024331 [Scortum barcoo]
MFEHKGVHQCTWHQDTLGRRSMIDFVVVSSDLWPYVLDTRVKRGAELSTDHHLVVSWIRWQEEEVGQTWQTQTFRGRLGTLSPSGPCSLPPLSTRRFEVVDARSLVPVVAATPEPVVVDTGSKGCRQRLKKESYRTMLACGTPDDAVDRYHWQAKQAAARTVLEAKTRVWEEFGEAMEEDYRSASKRDSGKPSGASEGGSSTLPTLFTVQVGSC